MAKFDVPASKPIYTLDLANIGGSDEYSTVPSALRSPDMKNIIKRNGMHQMRSSIEQTFITVPQSTEVEGEDDLNCAIKWVGKIEEYDDLGNPIPYYIKISEFLGTKNAKDESYIYISVWPTPDVKNIQYDMTKMSGCEKYRVTYKKYTFTNYGKTGNEKGLYEEVELNNKKYVFTPIGILSFNCGTEEANGIKTLTFNLDNVLNDPYIPTIFIAMSPNGLQRKTYESINLLTDKRRVKYTCDGSSKDYQLPEKVIKSVTSIKMLDEDGNYKTVDPATYTVNVITGKITFNTAPAVTPTTGMDNMIVEYEKTPFEGNETNQFELVTSTSKNFLKSTVSVTKATDATENDKIDIVLNIKITKGTSYGSNNNLTGANIKIMAGNIVVYEHVLTASEINTVKSGTLTLTPSTIKINNDGATETRNWSATLNCDVTTTITTTTTTGVPGSCGGVTTGANRKNVLSAIDLYVYASAHPHVGNSASDSYWDVYADPRLIVSGSISKNSVELITNIDGQDIGGVWTGHMSNKRGNEAWYGSGGVSKRIPYSNRSSVTIYVHCNIKITWGGVYRESIWGGELYLSLPHITLPTQKTVTNTSTTKSSDSNTSNYAEGIKHNEKTTSISYENNAKTSARLACYYSTKAATVYGYENDRRIFLTNGSNCDTFSGEPIDDAYSTISYFPDDNYHVLGDKSNILGYAQKQGYLFTIKEGADSLYVRKGTTLGDDTQFVSMYVARNLQILCKPIEIDGNVYVITRNGLEELNYEYVHNYTYELKSYLRSYYISNYFQLGVDYKYKQMEWYHENGLLHIFLDNYEFVFDLESKSYVKEQSSASGSEKTTGLTYQFEAYVCTIPFLNANVYAPHTTVYLPKDFERKDSGLVNTDALIYGYNNTGVYKFNYDKEKVDILLGDFDQISDNILAVNKIAYMAPYNKVTKDGYLQGRTNPQHPETYLNYPNAIYDTISVKQGDKFKLIVEFDSETVKSTATDVKMAVYDPINEHMVFELPLAAITHKYMVMVMPVVNNVSSTLNFYLANFSSAPVNCKVKIKLGLTDEAPHAIKWYDSDTDINYNITHKTNIAYYPIKAHYYTPFLDFNTITQLKTTKQIHIGTAGHNGDEYYIGYVLPDGSELLLDKIIDSGSDTLTSYRNGQIPFPKIIAIRNKIRKFTDVKLWIKSKADYENIDNINEYDIKSYNNLTFNRLTMQYVIAGKYRGE